MGREYFFCAVLFISAWASPALELSANGRGVGVALTQIRDTSYVAEERPEPAQNDAVSAYVILTYRLLSV